MAQDDVGIRSTHGTQADRGPEGEVVDEDGVRSDLLDDLDRPTGGLDWLPEQIARARLRLVAKRRDHTPAGGIEERPQVVVLASRLLLRSGDAGIRASAHSKSRELHAGSSHQRRHRGPGRHHDVLAGVVPHPGHADQRDGMRGVVRADDQEGHDASQAREPIATRL